MKQQHALWIGVLALFTLSGEIDAQEPSRSLRINPSFGSYLPTGDLGAGRGPNDSATSPEFLNLSRGLAVGIAVEAPVHPTFSLRAGVKYGFASDLVAGEEVGMAPCGSSCSTVAYERTPLTGASALLISADLSARPAPPTWFLRPYGLAGLAFRRHFYDSSVIPAGSASIQAGDQASRWVPHLGVGADLPMGSVTLHLEAEMFGDIELAGWNTLGGRYADAFVSLGLSLTR